MRLITAATGFLAASLLSALGGPSLSSVVFAPESRTTDLVGRRCQAESATGDEQLTRCPGLGGARVVVTSSRAGVALGFEWSAKERADEVLRTWSLGAELEWRGYTTMKGFDPYAATIRLRSNEGTAPSDRPVLAVMRVRRGEACLVGIVDGAATPDAQDVARRLADRHAPSFTCGRDTPRLEGVATNRAAGLLAIL